MSSRSAIVRRRWASVGQAIPRARLRSLLPNRIERPIFVIAPPRSGSTAVFERLATFPELTAFTHREAEHIWWRVLPYRERALLSDYIDPSELGPTGRRMLRGLLYAEATAATAQGQGRRVALGERLGLAPIRYLDKTISNCLHLEVLSNAFPDASFVWLVRDPRPNIASMIEGWPELERFGKPALTPYVRAHPRASVSHWTYPAPPGWQRVLSWSLVEICAWSWREHVRWALDFFARTAMPVHRMTYEEFTGDPVAAVRGIARSLGLGWTDDVAAQLMHDRPSRTTVTAPDVRKWHRHEAALADARGLYADVAAELGYDV